MPLGKVAFYGKYKFEIFDGVYEPAEDSYLLADNLQVGYGDIVLDLGTGCGILGIIAAEKAKKVVAIDISPIAVKCARHNVKTNNLLDKVDVRLGNLFQPLRSSEKFDLIIFNPPYLPKSSYGDDDLISKTWNGGKSGRDVIDKYLEDFDKYLKYKGNVQIVQSNFSNPCLTIRKFKDKGFSVQITASKKLPFFEKLCVLTAWR